MKHLFSNCFQSISSILVFTSWTLSIISLIVYFSFIRLSFNFSIFQFSYYSSHPYVQSFSFSLSSIFPVCFLLSRLIYTSTSAFLCCSNSPVVYSLDCHSIMLTFTLFEVFLHKRMHICTNRVQESCLVVMIFFLATFVLVFFLCLTSLSFPISVLF